MMQLILKSLITTQLILRLAHGFTFASIIVEPDTKVINTVTRYKFTYDRTQDDNLLPTAYNSISITPSDTISVTFPNSYTLTSVSCKVSINAGTPITPSSCIVSGFKVIATGIVSSNTFVSSAVLTVNNVLNPTPALVTDYFYGTIGSDLSGSGYYASTVVLQPGTFASCYITFNPNIVNSTSDMILSIVPTNSIGSAGSIKVQFPTYRRWINDNSQTNTLPIVSSMSCSNKSANVKTTFLCSGDNTAGVTASNLFASTVSGLFSFSINNFLSPPTEQPSDPIIITSFISGYQIDTCTTYVSNLSPKVINSIAISSSTGSPIIVNRQYLLRFTFTIVDTIAQTDTIILNFPSGTNLTFSTSTVSSNFSIFPFNATYDSNNLNLNLYMQNQNRTFGAGSVLLLTIGTYTTPPSIQPTSSFTLTFFQNGFRKMVGSTNLVASTSTVSCSVSIGSTAVNANTTYIFTIVTNDPISSSGKIKIVFPNTISILSTSNSCANINGGGLVVTPFCSYNNAQNSITFSALNSSSSNILAQNITITVNGIKNPSSTSPTNIFNIYTYFRSTDASLVATGTISGMTATTAVISPSQAQVSSSSLIVNDQPVSYFFQLVVANPIPASGYFILFVPSDVVVNPSAVSGQCSININNTSYVPTPCTAAAATNGNGVNINFTNPFIVDINQGANFTAKINSIFTNPSSTRPTSSFALYTFHSNGYSIANIQNSVSISMTTPDSFQAISISRTSQKNYDVCAYTFTIRQKSQFQASSVITIVFSSSISVTNPTCTLLSTNLLCIFSNSQLKITLPSSTIAANTALNLVVTNVRNPASFAPLSPFTIFSKTSGELFSYSTGISTTVLVNNIATPFQQINYTFTPAIYGQQSSLKIIFDPSENGVVLDSLKVTLANSFSIQSLSCNSFVNFVGTCNNSAVNTIQVTGTFTSAAMTFSIVGFTNPRAPVSDYSSVVSFNSGYRLDQSNNYIIFSVACSMPCRTCDAANSSICSSCYTNTLITTFIYYDSAIRSCFETCIDGKYSNSISYLCLNCDLNCLTCTSNATFCLKCNSTSIYKYMLVDTALFTQKCVSQCPLTMYPQASLNPVTCKQCISPCKQCNTSTICLSCLNGSFFSQNQCLANCPSGITVPNSGTSNCDFCDTNCLTCVNTTTNCISCNQSLLLYQGVCRTSCSSPLVPQNGTCGPCDTSCKTCANNPYNCTSCNTASSLPYLLNNLCLSQCPQTYYNNIGSGLCSLCSSVSGLNCRNCSSISTCLSCDVGFVFYQQSCLNYTPYGFVNISGFAVACVGDCQTCSIAVNNCTSCRNFSLYNYQCLASCPAGFISLSKVCQPCLSPCRTCVTQIDTCTSCLTTLSPSVFFSNNLCVQTCPDGTYPTQANYSCLSCQSPCAFCSSLSTCTSCANGFFLSGNSCLTVCPFGYTGINKLCQACLGNCATCQDIVTKCLSCKTDTYLLASSFTCVTTCGTGLYIDYLNRICVACTDPCRTCVNSTDTCLSCTTGILYNSQCLNQCPQKYFQQAGQCSICPANCSSCLSLISCTSCAQNFVLYNGFCITTCPLTHSVIINSVCTRCSTTNCHKCTSADFCTECDSSYSLYNGACLSQCPSGFQTNGTHCLDTNKQILTTTSAAFPVPFAIASIVIVIACLMSKLQFGHTFMSGAIYSLLSICEVGALAYFLYLYYLYNFFTLPLPFIVGVAAIGYLYLLNILAIFIQNCTICYDRDFKIWMTTRSHKLSSVLVNVFALILCHKFRNILFCKLFKLDIFTARLENVSGFKVINVFSFLSLLHSGAAIFAASVAISSSTIFTQFFYSCIDVIAVTGANILLAFFNIMKPDDFFYEKTADGFQLKKKINVDQQYYESKIEPEGKAIQDEQGLATNLYRTQIGTGFMSNELLKIRQNGSEDRDYSFGSLIQKEQISVQADPQINQIQQPINVKNNQSMLATSIEKADSAPNNAKSQKIYNKQIKDKSNQQNTIFYHQQKRQLRAQSDGQNLVVAKEWASKDNNMVKKQKMKKIYDSSGQQAKSQSNKNILYKPEFKNRYYKRQTSEDQKVNGSNYRPVEFTQEGQTQTKQKEEGCQIGDYGSRFQINSQIQKKKQPIIVEVDQQFQNVTKNNNSKDKSKTIIDQSSLLSKQKINEQQKKLKQKIQAKNQQINNIKFKIGTKQQSNSMSQNVKKQQVGQIGKLYRRASHISQKKTSNKNNNLSQNQQIIEKIQVVNQEGQRKIINVQFHQQQHRKPENINEQIIENLQEIIYNDENIHEDEQLINIQPRIQNGSKILAPQINQNIQKEEQIGINLQKQPTVTNRYQQNQIKKFQQWKQKDSQKIYKQNELKNSVNQGQLPIPQYRSIQTTKNIQNNYQSLNLDKHENVQDKRKSGVNPLKNMNRFKFQNEDKNISQSGEDQMAFRRPSLILPFETDKQQGDFRFSPAKNIGNVMIPRSKINNSSYRSRGSQSPPSNYMRNKSKDRNFEGQIKNKGNDLQNFEKSQDEPYIEQSEPQSVIANKNIKNQETINYQTDELQKYYQKQKNKNKSRQKSKKKTSQSQIHASKIYLQRQDYGKKDR